MDDTRTLLAAPTDELKMVIEQAAGFSIDQHRCAACHCRERNSP